MNVVLKPELEKFIEDKVRPGLYDSVTDAINAAVAHLQAGHDFTALSLDELRAEIDVGLAVADKGEFVEFTAEDVIAERRVDRRRRCGAPISFDADAGQSPRPIG